MERTPVQSSNLASVGYDPATRTLEIELRSGRTYRYINVPKAVYEGLMAAESKGSYFNEHIKDAGYPYSRIR
ncbi:MAG: KTSC domain-containing protein [Bacteroidetes bacterium]|nr:KTSC domain-containing protein [Bacteroidota bacterium]MCL5026881.1 KTSC domain-containing protein [Chloroflexota bacterium]